MFWFSSCHYCINSNLFHGVRPKFADRRGLHLAYHLIGSATCSFEHLSYSFFRGKHYGESVRPTICIKKAPQVFLCIRADQSWRYWSFYKPCLLFLLS